MLVAVHSEFTFDEQSHLYRDEHGAVILSTTQVLKAVGLISFDHISPRVLEHKRQLGTLVHRATEMYENGENLQDYEIPPEIFPHLDGYFNFRNDCGFVPELVEHRMIGETHSMRWGMTPDRVGMVSGVPHLIELKCGAAHPAHGIQLASYDMGLAGNGRTKYSRMSVQLGPDFPRGYKTFTWDQPSDYQIWLAALALATWKQNHNFSTEGVPERLID